MGKSLVIKGADFSAIAIPKEFVTLDWMASGNGLSYFNTGFKPVKASNRFELDFALTAAFLSAQTGVLSPSVVLFGDGANGYNTNTGIMPLIRKYPSVESVNNTISIKEEQNYFGTSGNYAASGKISDSTTHTLSVCQTSILLDGLQAMSKQPSGGTLETPINNGIAICGISGIPPAYLVGLDSTSGPGYRISNGVHTSAFRIFANVTDTEPSHNFIPVKRIADGLPYFYDTLHETYIAATNSGTGIIYSLNGTVYNYDGTAHSE